MVDRYQNRSCRSGLRRVGNMNTPSTPPRPDGGHCHALKRQLQAIDFSIVETVLYLDAYPNCRQALDYYHKLIAEREALVSVINEKCGPVSARENKSRTEWNWIRGPWPWELDANS